MSTLATPVLRTAVAPGWAHSMLVQTTVGHEVMGLLLPDGARILTAHSGQDAVRVAPAFADVVATPGDWPAAVSGRPTARAIATLDLAIAQPPHGDVRCVAPSTRTRGLAPLRTADGRPGWGKVAIMGPVPGPSNRTTSALYLACLTGAPAPLLPGTPVFRLEDGACIGLLVPDSSVTTRLTAPWCVVAAVEEPTGSQP